MAQGSPGTDLLLADDLFEPPDLEEEDLEEREEWEDPVPRELVRLGRLAPPLEPPPWLFPPFL